MTDLQKRLFALQDLKYRDFESKLMPSVDKNTVIGVRTPLLRKIAKEFSKEDECENFLNQLPHEYYEENNIHGFIVEGIKDFDECVKALDEFLPFIDNWATCDEISPKALKKNLPALHEKVKVWLLSDRLYTVRFAVGMLMKYFLDDNFKTEYCDEVSAIKSDEYYINMMIAWYFATALAKHYDEVLPYIESKKLGKWVHNKTIQKACESYRVTSEQKEYLKTLKLR